MSGPAHDSDSQAAGLTVRQFEQLEDDPFWRYELVRGRVVREPPPGAAHGSVAAMLAHLLLQFVEPLGLGQVRVESGYILARDPDTVRGPDVSFVKHGRTTGYLTERWPDEPPDLAVEVLSPRNRAGEVREKVADYLAAGCPLVWVVDPRRRTMTVHEPQRDPRVLDARDRLEGGTVLPGLSLLVLRLFS